MARLEVEIGAEIKDLQSKVGEASKTLNNFSNKADKDLKNLGKSANVAGKGLTGLKKGAISGNSAMTAFSRTVQDAPFGIMGVSNNITNLTEQFGYLKNKTGSAKGALSAMLKDLKGFGGISLAVSVVTSLLLVFGDKIFASKNKVKDLKEEQEKLTKSLDNYVLGLEAVKQANVKGEKNAAKELTTLRLLKAQLNNTNLSLNERKGAIESLRKKYPSYLKNMSDEKLLNGGLATVYDTLTTSILKRAKATAASNAIIKNSGTLLVLESQLLALESEKGEIIDKANKKLETSSKSQVNSSRVRTGLTKNEINALNEKKDLVSQIQNLELSNIDLEQNVTGLGGVAKAIVPSETSTEVKARLDSVFSDLKGFYTSNVQGFQETINQDVIFTSVLGASLTQFEKDALTLKAKLLELNEEIKGLIGGAMANTFSGIGQAIGNGLSQGLDVMAAVGSALLKGIGNLISAMGDKLIQLGTAAVLAGTVTKLFGTIAGIGAGFAAIAGGIALNAIGSGISGSADGGGSNAEGGSGSNSGGFRGSSTSGFSSGGGGGTVVFEIAGTKLVGVLSNTLKRNRNLGGSLSIT